MPQELGVALLSEGVRSWKPGVYRSDLFQSGSAGLASVGFQRLSPESWPCSLRYGGTTSSPLLLRHPASEFPSLSKRLGLWGAAGVLATALPAAAYSRPSPPH